jgi:hypothetical protein
MAMKELNVVEVLQKPNLCGDGGLTEMQILSCTGETPCKGHGMEGAKLGQAQGIS